MTTNKIPLPEEVDGIFIGGGHNNIVAANYLGRAGAQVLVLESQPKIGGGLTTKEVTLPLFKHNLHAYFVRWTPDYLIWNDLQPSRYGLQTFVPEVQNSIPFRDGGGLVTYNSIERSLAAIRELSPHDAETYGRVYAEYDEMVHQIINPLDFAPPLPSEELETLLKRSELGRRFLELNRYSALDLIRELFEHEAVRTLVLFNVSVRGYLPVLDAPNSGYIVPKALFGSHHGAMIKGGSYEATRALAASLFACGGVAATNTRVERIIVEQNRATGVELSDGRRVRARKFICSNLAAPLTLGRLVEAQHLDSGLREAALNYSWNAESLFGVHLALREPPHYRGVDPDSPLHQALNYWVGYETSDDFERDMHQIRDGVIPSDLGALHVSVPTRFDPSQAPPGYTTTFAWQFVPNRPADGGAEYWNDDTVSETFAEQMVAKWREYAPNLAKAEIARAVHSPGDTQRHVPSMMFGDRHHGSQHPDNVFANRPHPSLSNYQTPIAGLYLCGASTHPGGSFTGQPGYNAATVIAKDLGYELWWKPKDPYDVLP